MCSTCSRRRTRNDGWLVWMVLMGIGWFGYLGAHDEPLGAIAVASMAICGVAAVVEARG
jgi:hypothetical protein